MDIVIFKDGVLSLLKGSPRLTFKGICFGHQQITTNNYLSMVKSQIIPLNKIIRQYKPVILVLQQQLQIIKDEVLIKLQFYIMNVKVQREEQSIKKIDYNRYLDGFQSISTSTTNRQPQKIKSKSTLRPFTAHQLMKSLRQSISNHQSQYIQSLIKRKGLLNIEYQAIKTQPKFQSYLKSNPQNKTEGISYDISPKNYPQVLSQENELGSEYKSGRIYNTLGIKRNKSGFRLKDLNNPQIFVKSPLFNKQYHPINKFPNRKNNLLKIKQKSHSKTVQNRVGIKSQGQLRAKVINILKNDVSSRRIRQSPRSSITTKKDLVKLANEPFSHQKLIQGIKMIIHK